MERKYQRYVYREGGPDPLDTALVIGVKDITDKRDNRVVTTEFHNQKTVEKEWKRLEDELRKEVSDGQAADGAGGKVHT